MVWVSGGVPNSQHTVLARACASQWKCNEAVAELIILTCSLPARLPKSSSACFLGFGCGVQQKLKCVLSSGPKSCAVLTDTGELQQLIFSTPCAVDKRAAFLSLRVTKGFTTLISALSSPSELKLGQVTSKPARKSMFFLLVLPWGTKLSMKVLEKRGG